MKIQILIILYLLIVIPVYAQTVGGYIPEYRSTAQVDAIKFSNLTDVYYSISYIPPANRNQEYNANGNIHVFNAGLFSDVQTHCQNNNVKLYLSILDSIGLTLSSIAANATSRQTFANKLAAFCAANGLAGIDLDWENPLSSESQNFISLLADIRTSLTNETQITGKSYKLSIAAPAYNGSQNGITSAILQYIDYLHIMAYDGTPNSPVSLSQSDIGSWANVGCPYSKMILGIPFYGRDSYGYAQAYSALNILPGTLSAFDGDYLSGYYYNGEIDINNKISYVMGLGCQGVYGWELTQDLPGTSQYSLLAAMRSIMNQYVMTTCQTPQAPTPTFGASDCSTSSTATGAATTALTFNSNGGVQFKAQASQYPYGSTNIIYNPPCQSSTAAFQAGPLKSGMLYRWNMYAYGATDCASCQSAVSSAFYFSLPPTIITSGYNIVNGQPITLSTVAQTPGAGATVNYRWLKDGQMVAQGPQQMSYITAQPGTYTMIIDYSGSQVCTSTSSTAPSNAIVITQGNSGCTPSVQPTSIVATPAGGSATKLTLNGGSLGTNAKWVWYTGGCGSLQVQSQIDNITVSPAATTTYYVRAESDCQAPSTCDSITVNVSGGCTPSAAPLSISQSLSADRTQLQLTVIGGTLGTNALWHWYTGDCFGTPLTTSSGSSIIVDPSIVTTYYVKAEGGDCSTTTTCAYTIVNIPICTPSTNPSFISQSDTVTDIGKQIKLSVVGGSLGIGAQWVWYSGSDCGSTLIGESTNNYLLLASSTTGTYSVRAEGGDCGNTACVFTQIAACTPSIRPDSLGIMSVDNGFLITIYGGQLGTNASWALHSETCDGSIVGGTSSNNITVNPLTTTTYFLTANGGCSVQDCVSTTITVVPSPVINSFQPTSAVPGTTITVSGSNFSNATAVTFGGVPAASFQVVSDNSIMAVVGQDASGDVDVTTASGTANLSGFDFVFGLPANNFTVTATSATCAHTSDGSIHISANQAESYKVVMTSDNGDGNFTFSDTLTINNLLAGTYHVCISVANQPNYVQCFDLVVTQPEDLSVYTLVNQNNRTVTLNLDGGAIYFIDLNGTAYTTTANSINLPLPANENVLTISTDKPCQGTITKHISAGTSVVPYPDPFQNVLNLDLRTRNIGKVSIDITSVGNTITLYSKQFGNQTGVIQLDVSNLPTGVYVLKLSLDNEITTYKIIKQ